MPSVRTRENLDDEGNEILKSILPDDLPDIYFQMPFNWVERLWRYCLWVWVTPRRGQRDAYLDIQETILNEDHGEPLFHKFKLFLLHMRETSYPNHISSDVDNIMRDGMMIVTKSWLKISPGEVQEKNITFLEHYLLILREKPESEVDTELLELLKQFCPDSEKTISEYSRNSHKFLGTMI